MLTREQKKILELLKEIDIICRKNKITYYIEETDQKMERGSRFCENAGPAVFFYAAVNAAKNGNCSAGLHTCCVDCNKIQA